MSTVMDMGHSFNPVEIIPAIPVAEACAVRDAGTAPVASAGRWKDWHVVCRALYGEFAH